MWKGWKSLLNGGVELSTPEIEDNNNTTHQQHVQQHIMHTLSAPSPGSVTTLERPLVQSGTHNKLYV